MSLAKRSTKLALPEITLLRLVLSAAAEAPLLPWQREVPLREATQSVVFLSTLEPEIPLT